MKHIFPLPQPKNEDLIRHINGKLRDIEKHAGIKSFDIKTKANRNEVVIVYQREEQLNNAQELLNDLIDNFLNTIIIELQHDEMMNKNLRCFIIGKQGKTVKSIEEKTNTQIKITPKGIYVTSDIADHRKQAEIEINNLIDKIQLRKVVIPSEVKGRVIGKGHSNRKKIEEDAGVIIDVSDKINMCIYGEEKNCKQAILQLKQSAAEIVGGTFRKQLSCDSFDYISTTTGADDPHCTYKLSSMPSCPNTNWNQDKEHFKITVDEENENMDDSYQIDREQLKTFIHDVLTKIQKEKCSEGKISKADLWCHFGHIYVKNVDEDDQDKHFTLQEFQKEFNGRKDGWRMLFDPAIKDMEIKSLEEALSAEPNCFSVNPHIRYDFQFLTPSCSKIRVKIFLNDQPNGQPNAEFSKADIDVIESSSPLYFLCGNFYHRAKVSIAIPCCGMDVRMTIRTVAQIKSDDKKEKGFEETLRQYLDKIEVKEGEIVWPDNKELPDDFCLSYLRRCKRRSYKYSQEQRSYSVTMSEEEEMDVLDREVVKKKTDIHIHSDEWDQLLSSGEWEPEKIVCDLPQFLSLLQEIQSNISAPEQES